MAKSNKHFEHYSNVPFFRSSRYMIVVSTWLVITDCKSVLYSIIIHNHLSICLSEFPSFLNFLAPSKSLSLSLYLSVCQTVVTWSRRLVESHRDLLLAASLSLSPSLTLSLSHCLSLSLSVCQHDKPYQGARVEPHRDFLPAASLSSLSRALSLSVPLLGGWWQEVKTLSLRSLTAGWLKAQK